MTLLYLTHSLRTTTRLIEESWTLRIQEDKQLLTELSLILLRINKALQSVKGKEKYLKLDKIRNRKEC